MGGALTRTGSPIEIISNVLNIAAIAVIAFNWTKDDNTGNTDNTKSITPEFLRTFGFRP